MEIGDLIYVILLLLFMILGFFNDFRKKKEQQNQQQRQQSIPSYDPNDKEITKDIPPVLTEEQKKIFELEREKRLKRINREKERRLKESKPVFKSSMDLLTDFKKESSLGSSIYINDTDSFFDMEPETLESYNSEFEVPEMSDENRSGINPLVEDLLGINRRRELTKGIIYGEILNRKY